MEVIFCSVLYLQNLLTKNKRYMILKAIEDKQQAQWQIEWVKERQEQLDYINNKIMREHKAEKC